MPSLPEGIPDVPCRSGCINKSKHESSLRRPDGPAERRSAADVVGGASLTHSGAERRARTTTVAMVSTAQNGTSGTLVERKHAGRGATWDTLRSGVQPSGAR
jgi:hypothetical protein